ncbi:ImmA/IrrE family metallo-endopeptidase [Pseudomonas sp. NY15366]
MVEHKEKAPSRLLKDLGLYRVPVDLDELCRRIGVNKNSKMKFVSHSGEISVSRNGEVEIWINPIDAPNRRRFTLAHEIGHLVHDIIPYLDGEGGADRFVDDDKTLRRDGRQHPEEYRANDYAAKLLMPRALVLDYADEIIEQIKAETGRRKVDTDEFVYRMARVFEVSEQAMEIRLSNIGIIE